MRAFLFLLLLFPVLELFVFFQVGTAIGFFPALLLIIAGSALGALIMRLAGLATALSARQSLQRGEMPGAQMLNGMMLTLGGGLLLVPGFISDVLGLLCLLPFTRHRLASMLQRRAEEQAQRQRAFAGDAPAPGEPPRHRPEVIEGEYERRDN
ncbi:FxsA family protein [Pseudomonas typographi]|uniref:Membrane protein FxsA n=1 Tax=Pseudomonas typographi TaxID=2715964 RepID=A0ABR7YW87_9PSED|nr:FxsA family protein [Pseudomonas typographi]MBD1552533.1 membrane protein FxsA [Pseudomonas typographi]MBD1585624.1 membrane protein FxsA [Pseudomonas typographi]MBD1597463.1 membrane protein FxsA [Pseudomonas typographi]